MASRLGCTLAAVVAVLGLSFSAAFGQSSATYTYDFLGRVLTSTTSLGVTTYTYDNAGNRTQVVSCVTGCNHAPVAYADGPYNVPYGALFNMSVLGNDTDADGDTLTVASVSGGNKGTPSPASDGKSVNYQALAGQTGPDSFTYIASDGHSGGLSNPATVSVYILPQIPVALAVNNFPITYNATNSPVTLSWSGGTPTSANVITQASNGQAQPSGSGIVYTPNRNTSGPDSFTYTLTNLGGTSNQATVTLVVAQAPVGPPTVSDVSPAAFGYNSGSNAITPSVAGTATSVAPASQPSYGTASGSGMTLYYQPNSTFYGGNDSFTYNATGPGGTSIATATVHVVVNPPAAPTVGSFPVSVGYNSGANTITLQPSGYWSSMAAGTASKGSLSAISGTQITYTPYATSTGTDTFTYTATGPAGAVSNTGTVTISIAAAPGALTAQLSDTIFDISETPGGNTQSPPGGIVVTASGGRAPYSYTWQYVSGSTAPLFSGGANVGQWYRSGTLHDNTVTAYWNCLVTDNVGATFTTGQIQVIVEESTQAPQPGGHE